MSNKNWPFRPALANALASTSDRRIARDGHSTITTARLTSGARPVPGGASWTGSGREALLWLSLVCNFAHMQ